MIFVEDFVLCTLVTSYDVAVIRTGYSVGLLTVISDRCVLLATWRVRRVPVPIPPESVANARTYPRTLSIAAGQTITLTTVLGEVSRRLPDVQTSTIISAGATNLAHAVSSPEVLHTLRSIWNLAVSRTMILSLAAVGASVPFTFGMEWLNARKISMERKERGQPLGSEAISLERVNASEKV